MQNNEKKWKYIVYFLGESRKIYVIYLLAVKVSILVLTFLGKDNYIFEKFKIAKF